MKNKERITMIQDNLSQSEAAFRAGKLGKQELAMLKRFAATPRQRHRKAGQGREHLF